MVYKEILLGPKKTFLPLKKTYNSIEIYTTGLLIVELSSRIFNVAEPFFVQMFFNIRDNFFSLRQLPNTFLATAKKSELY